jgi:hypothetical protein
MEIRALGRLQRRRGSGLPHLELGVRTGLPSPGLKKAFPPREVLDRRRPIGRIQKGMGIAQFLVSVRSAADLGRSHAARYQHHR